MQVLLRHWLGGGFDDVSLQRALDLEDGDTVTSIVTRPSMHNAMLLSFTGSLDEAHEAMRSISDRCRDTGDESELVFVAFHQVLLEIWRGELSEAAAIADDAMAARIPSGRQASAWRRVDYACRCRRIPGTRRGGPARSERGEGRSRVGRVDPADLLAEHRAGLRGSVTVSPRGRTCRVEPLLARMHPDAMEIFVAAFIPDA